MLYLTQFVPWKLKQSYWWANVANGTNSFCLQLEIHEATRSQIKTVE